MASTPTARASARAWRLAAVALSAAALAACGGEGDEPAEPAPAEPVAVDGRQVFVDTGCGACHRLAAAGTTGERHGPDLDESAAGESAMQIRSSIVDPNAEITEGFRADVMPTKYGEQLSDEELDALADFIASSAGE